MPARPPAVSGPVEIVDRAIEHARESFAAAFFLGIAPNLVLAEGVFWALLHAPELAGDPRRCDTVAAVLAAGILAKGVFVAAQLIHADSVLEGRPRALRSCLGEALRHGPRAIAARSLWVLVFAAGLLTGILLPLLPLGVIASRRPLRGASRLVGRVLFRPARPMGEGWSKIPFLQCLIGGVFLFLLGNFAAMEMLIGYLVSGLPGSWQNIRAALSPISLPGGAAAVLASLSILGPIATSAARFLEEDLEGRVSGHDLEVRLLRLEA